MKRLLAGCLALVRRFRREALALAAVVLLQHQGWLPVLPADPFDPRLSAAAAAPAPSPLWLTALTLAVALAGFFVPGGEAARGAVPDGRAAGGAEEEGVSPLPRTRPGR
ncbi:MAG: hypothetical protein K6U79_08650 [Firmicutes bacterium]|nr:hypothetical protein [Bacillota bacterium]